MSDEQTQAYDPSGPGWRDVGPDEIIQAGDMFKNGMNWERSNNPGWKAKAVCGVNYRRRIEPEQKAEAADDHPIRDGWRWVRQGEMLRCADEQWIDDTWHPTTEAGYTCPREHTYRRRIEPQQPSDSTPETMDDIPRRLAEAEALLAEAERSGEQANAELQEQPEPVRIPPPQLLPLDDAGDDEPAEIAGGQLVEIEGQGDTVQVREGRWKTRAGEIVSVSAMPTDHDDFSGAYAWWDGDVLTWANNGVFFSGYTTDKDLVEYLGPIEPKPEPQPVPEHLQAIISAQAETIARLQSEAHELNMEIGGLQGNLSRRQARIRDLETMHAEAAQAETIDDLRRRLAAAVRQNVELANELEQAQRSKTAYKRIAKASVKRAHQAEALLAEAERSGEQVNAELQELRERVQTLTRERDRYRNRLEGAIEHSGAPEAQARLVGRLQAWLRPVLELVAENPDDSAPLAIAVLGYLPGIASRLIEE